MEFRFYLTSLGNARLNTLNLEIHEFIEASINQLSDFCEGTDSVQLTATTTIGNWSVCRTHIHKMDGLTLQI